VAALELLSIERRQLRIPARRQLGGFDQYGLQPGIALLGNGTTLLLAGRGSEGCG